MRLVRTQLKGSYNCWLRSKPSIHHTRRPKCFPTCRKLTGEIGTVWLINIIHGPKCSCYCFQDKQQRWIRVVDKDTLASLRQNLCLVKPRDSSGCDLSTCNDRGGKRLQLGASSWKGEQRLSLWSRLFSGEEKEERKFMKTNQNKDPLSFSIPFQHCTFSGTPWSRWN